MAAGIVLAGGRSTRMGADKAALPWAATTLLAHVCAVVGEGVDGPVIVVAADRQGLPALPPGVRVVRDARPERGPLQGLATGLAAVTEKADVAFVAATDAPLLRAGFVRCVVDALGEEDDVSVPEVDGRRHPLAAAYRTALHARADAAVARGELRLLGFLEGGLRVRALGADELRAADPSLGSVRNLNDRAAYDAALGDSSG